MDVLSQKVKVSVLLAWSSNFYHVYKLYFLNFGILFSFLYSSASPCQTFSFLLALFFVAEVDDQWLGPGCFPSQLRGRKRKWREENRGGMVGSDMRNLVSVGKNLLSLHMVYREDDKNSYSNRTMNKMVDKCCRTEWMTAWKNEWLDEGMDEWIAYKYMCVFTYWLFFSAQCCMSAICLVSVSIRVGQIFFIPRKTLVSVSPVEKMLEFWQGGIFTVALSVSPFFLSLHKPSVSSGARFSRLCGKLESW